MPERRSSADPRALLITDETIHAIGPLAPSPRITTEIRRRCALEKMEPPSPASVRARIAHQGWRSEGEPGGGLRLIVDQTRLLYPVRVGGEVLVPSLTVAFLDPIRIVVAHRITPGPPNAEAAVRIMTDIARREDLAPAIVVRCPAVKQGGWGELRTTLINAGVEVAHPIHQSLRLGREIDLLIGSRLGRLRLGGGRIDLTETRPFAELVEMVDEGISRLPGAERRTPKFTLLRFAREELVASLEGLSAAS